MGLWECTKYACLGVAVIVCFMALLLVLAWG